MKPSAQRRTGAHGLLGPPGPARAAVVQTLMWGLLHLGCCALFAIAAQQGLLRPGRAAWLVGLLLGQSLLFYALVRSGADRRLAGWVSGRWSSDPAFTRAQLGLALATLVLGCIWLEDGRGAVVGLPVLLLMFGAFALPPRQTLYMGVGALVSVVLAIGWMAWLAPSPPVRRVETFHLAFAALSLSAALALALRLSQLVQRLHQQGKDLQAAQARIQAITTSDDLTGVANRRHLHDVLAQAVERAHRHGLPFCAALVDVDQFRRINSQHGHDVGDRVLRGYAELARRHVRTLDVVGRWGGERFLLVMPGSTLREAEPVLERVRHHVATTGVGGLPAGAVTVSASLAQYRPGEAITLTLERADRILQAAKGRGRNRVHLAPSQPHAAPAGAEKTGEHAGHDAGEHTA